MDAKDADAKYAKKVWKTRKMKEDLLYKELVYKTQGILFEIYKTLGPGFKESIYQNAIEEELNNQNIVYKRESPLIIKYKEKQVGFYRPDFIVDDKIILEIKAVPEMPTYFETQLFYYLKATNYKLGLLVNFGCDGGVDVRRRIYDLARKK